MRFTSAISGEVDPAAAVDDIGDRVLNGLGGLPCHFITLFVSSIYQTDWAPLMARLQEKVQPEVLIGCSASGIIGAEQELEWVPAVSAVAANLPGVKLYPFMVNADELERAEAGGFWIDKVGAAPGDQPVFVLFVDPYTCEPRKLLGEINETYRERPVVGGLASGGQGPGEQHLILGGSIVREGAIGVAMTGNITMDTIVSQGCRPIGRPYVVTQAEENLIVKLAGRPAVAALHEALASLSSEDRELAQQGAVFAGLVVDEMRPKFGAGDFLIRNIIGIDPASGALAVGDEVPVGKTLQFHLRDAATSRDELRRLLQQHGHLHQFSPPAGALFFNCLGRGRSLYGVSNHDVRTIRTMRGKFPIGGFFCNGEIGPLGSTNFLHGYTASIGLFRPGQLSAPSSGRTPPGLEPDAS
ncbi:MAG TPA: FIST N-terminal domain-containing protein [bacterium]